MAEIPQATQAKHFQNCSHRHALISFCSAAVLQRGCLAGPSWNKSINLGTSQLLLPLGNPYCSCLLQIVHMELSLGLTMSLIGWVGDRWRSTEPSSTSFTQNGTENKPSLFFCLAALSKVCTCAQCQFHTDFKQKWKGEESSPPCPWRLLQRLRNSRFIVLPEGSEETNIICGEIL